MPPPKRESMPGRGSTPKNDGRAPNGDRSKFRTDAAISNSRFGSERVLQPWVPDAGDTLDGSLEKSSGGGGWDQFAENERLFGLKTDYDENMYTTVINKSHPQYRERKAIADKKAQEIERSNPATAHVAEERVMDYVQRGDEKENEEDKYSGVRRQQEFPPLSDGRGNKYTPPAKRAPAGQSTVKGAPIDPAIISSQIKAPTKKSSTPTLPEEKPKSRASDAGPTTETQNSLSVDSAEIKAVTPDSKTGPESASTSEAKAEQLTADAKPTDNGTAATKSSGTPNRTLSPSKRDPATPANPAPSATSTVEKDVLKEFKHFASQQRMNAEKARSTKARHDKETKLADLKKFADQFKLTTPVPTDLVSIIAKDPAKQKEIQAKAMKNAEEMAKKVDTPSKEGTSPAKEPQPKPAEQKALANANDSRSARAPTAPQNAAGGPSGARHQNSRQQYPQQQMYHGQQPYRNNRGGPQHGPMQHQQPGTLAQRLRHVEQQRYSQAPAPQPHASAPDVRVPPTGPANTVDPNFNRRASAVPVHLSAKALNPNTQEFQPRASAAPFNPNGLGPSAGSSPRSAVNNASDLSVSAAPQSPLIRRKTKAIDSKKCYILAHVKTFKPPQGRNWEDNGGLRPSYDTLPTWRQLRDDEKAESTMRLTYKEHFDRQPFSGPSMTTPNPQHAMPQIPHQHQLPFHLQQGAHNIGMRQSPHMGHMQMHNNQHGQHPPFGNDDHRMLPSSSSQSFASPRMGQTPMAYNGMGSPAHVPYNQPVFMPPGAPQMGYRSFSNNQQYMPPQQGHQPMMMQPQFMHGPQGMVGGPQMMYPGAHPQFMPPGGPHQPMPGANGYPSPGRPQAPMMVHQGSQQGQNMYGMSPNVQYNQPAYGPGQGGGPSQ